MEKILWNDSYSVGVEEIDKQHQEFFRLIYRLQIMQENNSPRELTLRILRELCKYADYHFTSEENLMLIVKCPELELQQEEYRVLLRSALERIESFEAGEEGIESFIDFLKDWLISHIMEKDTVVGRYIAAFARDRGDPSARGA